MKRLLFILLFFVPFIVNATNYYCSSGGSDSNNGSIGSPWKSLTRASAFLAAKTTKGAGDTVFVRGGTYNGFPNNPANGYAQLLINGLQGTATNPCVFINYPNESPLFDFFSVVVQPARPSPTALSIFASSYLKVIGLRFYGYHQITDGSGVSRGVELNGCSNITIQQCEVFSFQGTGFFISGGTQDVLYLNCDSHNNEDPLSATTGGAPGSDAWDNADGFGVTGTGNNSTRITFDGCRAWLNCDDGWDNFGTDGSRLWKNCWAYANGYYQRPGMPVPLPAGNGQGFKLGPTGQPLLNVSGLRNLQNCLAFNNRASGYDQNGEVTTIMTLLNCTAYGNQVYGFQFQFYPVSPQTIAHVIKNCSALSNAGGNVNLASAIPSGVTNNSWQPPVTISAADFLSTDTTGVSGARQADGSLPNLNFMKLASTSDLINSGVNVNLPFCGSAPDINWAEYCPSAVAPIVSAGSDQAFALPLNQATVAATAITSGTIASWFWRAISFPSAPTIGNPSVATTTISNLIVGTYKMEVTATDNAGLTGKDTMQIVISAAPAVAPSCSAAPTPVSITLPTNSFALVATASTSPVSNGYTVLWERTVGTAGAVIANPAALSTTVTGATAQTYNYRVTITDNVNGLTCQSTKVVVVNPAPIIPVANGGSDQVLTAPISSTSLSGSGSGGTINSYQWSIIQGVGGSLSSPTTANTNISSLGVGIYKVQLRVGNTAGNFGFDTMQITINPAPVAPTCNSGLTPTNVTLPVVSIALTGSAATTPASNGYSVLWERTVGTAGATIANPAALTTSVSGVTAQTYNYRITITDNVSGLTCQSTKVIVVSPAPNQNPTSLPCCSQSITLPVSGVSLTGSGTDPDGTIVAWLWQQTAGIPAVIGTPNSQNTNITGMTTPGNYSFSLRVTDNNGGTGSATVTIIVNPAVIPNPTVIARADTTIILPTNSCALTAVATGSGLTYKWNKLSASAGNIVNSTSLNATAQNLVEAVYLFEIVVTDVSMNIVRDTFQLTVMPIPVYEFTVSAGNDTTIYSPATSLNLVGTAFSSYGTIDSYLWQQISGNASVIGSPNTATTSISSLTVGVYRYSLTCTTSFGWQISDSVTVTVSPLPYIGGFQWYMAAINNGRAELKWIYNGAKTGSNFQVQKKFLWWFNKVEDVKAFTGKAEYSFTDLKTSSGTSTYRVRYNNDYTNELKVKKNN